MFKVLRETIQQHTAVRYNSCYGELRWTSVSNNLSPRLQKSDVLSEAKCSLSAVAAVCWYLFVIWWRWGVEGGRAEYYI